VLVRYVLIVLNRRSPLVPEILVCHEDIEELLETFLMDYNSLESKLEHLRVQIQSAEELVSLRLDTSRNELLVANTAMAVLAVCIGFNSYIAGIFGMNLDNVDIIQPVPGIFFTVFGVTLALIFVSFYLIILYYTETGVLPKRVRKRIK
jgi:Mg2+ and Co2+ transporter CorA